MLVATETHAGSSQPKEIHKTLQLVFPGQDLLEEHRNTNGRGLEHSVTMQTLMTGGPCTDRIQEITTSTTWSGLGSGMSMISRRRTWVGLSTGMILGARVISWKIGASTDGAIERSMIGKQIQP